MLAFSYRYTVPYQGGGILEIINNDPTNTTSVQSITFTNNAVMSGAPYGTLFPYGANCSSITNPDGLTVTYFVTEPGLGLNITGGGSAQLSYGWSSALGLFNIAMGPTIVLVNGVVTPIAGQCVGDACNDPTPGKRINGYYTFWDKYARNFTVEQIPLQVNHISYAFIGFDSGGTLNLLDEGSDGEALPALAMRRQQYPYTNVLLAFGGWGLASLFSELAANASSVKQFAQNAVAAMKQVQANGLVIDWEYPVYYGVPADAANFANLMQTLRNELDEQVVRDRGYNVRRYKVSESNYILNIAAPGGVDKIAAIQNADPNAWCNVAAVTDQFDVMDYDFHGGFDQGNPSDFMSAVKTDPNDPYFQNPIVGKYDISDANAAYLELGCVNNLQLGNGLPAYGRASLVQQPGANKGLWQTITGVPSGQYDNTGIFDYICIALNECHGYKGIPSDMEFMPASTNSYAQTPWGYSPSSLMFLTYDDANSARTKAELVLANDLGGMMLWTLSGDAPVNNPASLLGAVYNVFTNQGSLKKSDQRASLLVEPYAALTTSQQPGPLEQRELAQEIIPPLVAEVSVSEVEIQQEVVSVEETELQTSAASRRVAESVYSTLANGVSSTYQWLSSSALMLPQLAFASLPATNDVSHVNGVQQSQAQAETKSTATPTSSAPNTTNHKKFALPASSMDDKLVIGFYALHCVRDYLPWNRPYKLSTDELDNLKTQQQELEKFKQTFAGQKTGRVAKSNLLADKFAFVDAQLLSLDKDIAKALRWEKSSTSHLADIKNRLQRVAEILVLFKEKSKQLQNFKTKENRVLRRDDANGQRHAVVIQHDVIGDQLRQKFVAANDRNELRNLAKMKNTEGVQQNTTVAPLSALTNFWRSTSVSSVSTLSIAPANSRFIESAETLRLSR